MSTKPTKPKYVGHDLAAGFDSTTVMIARTQDGDPVWRTGNKGRPFIIVEEGTKKKPVGALWWWPKWPNTIRLLPEPHLSYAQVSLASSKANMILQALRDGPIYIVRGFLKRRNGKVLTTTSIGQVVLHWMQGCGFVFTRRELKNGHIEIDLNLDETTRNKVK